jgi:hypothetical protein
MRRSARILALTAVVLAFALALLFTPPRGPRSIRQFNAVRVADLELRMWQAYYAKDRARLFALLVTMLREQYRYPWATATVEALHLARAAATFSDLTTNYDQVLPDLEAAYGTVRSWADARFDPRAVARAELAWWVARRIRGQNSAEQVGRLIAEEYGLLYETAPEKVAAAALLRATAARLRDDAASNPDWDRIGRLLQESYRELLAALSTENV